MRKHQHLHRRTPPGAPPGTLVADPAAPPPRIRLIAYGPETLEEHEVAAVDEIPKLMGRQPVTWINVDGLGDTEVVRRIGALFGLHPLALEDVVNVHQRPKAEDYGRHLFLVFRMPSEHRGRSEQVSLFLADGLVLTFQERPGDSFDPVRARLRAGRGVIRGGGADYLAYALIDAAIDGFFPVLEGYDDLLDELTDEALGRPDPSVVERLHQVKRELFHHRRNVWSSREMLNILIRDEHPAMREETRPYLRDCYDHCIQLMDMLEMQREVAAGLFDVYLSSLSNRLNEIMKVLTMIATIFIPLTFIAGIYGMNFDPEVSPWNMPELKWVYGYPFALALMAAVAAGLYLWFRRRGWVGDGRPRPRRRATRASRRAP